MPALAMSALVGVLAGLWLPTSGSMGLAGLLLLVGPLFWWFGGAQPLLGMLGFVCAGIACHDYRAATLTEALAGEDLLVSGVVSSFPKRLGSGHLFYLDIQPSNQLVRFPARIRLRTFSDELQPALGERWQFKVRLKPPFGFVNPGGFDRSVWLLAMGVHATGYVRTSLLNRQLDIASSSVQLTSMRAHIRTGIESVLGDTETLPFILGITVGARDRISDAQWALLRATGTSHLMAISGLHIGMIAMALWYLGLVPGWIACVCGRSISSHGIARVMAAVGALAYAMLAGFSLPTVRAVCMVLMVLILGRYHRYLNRSGILGFALLWVVLTDPLAILTVGFWLSFAAVALLYLCLTSRWSTGAGTGQKLLQWLWRPVRAQWVLGLGLALPMCLFFGQVSLVAPVANLLAVPVFTFLILPAALSGAALSLVLPAVAAGCLQLASAGLELLLALLRGLDQRPFSIWETGAMPIGFLLSVAAGSLMLLIPRPLAAYRTGLALIALGITLNHGSQPAIVSVRVLDVGQGLAVLVQTPSHSLLYDAGPAWPGGDAGLQVLIPALRRVGIRDIDIMMISHADNDHRGGAISVLNAFHVGQIVGPPELQAGEHSVVECQSGTRWQWDGVWFEILHPRTRAGWSDNNASCVLQISVDGRSLVLLGDIEATAEIVLLARNELIPADVVIAPHHGSTTSSTKTLVNYLSPAYVVFAAGYKNRWNFPATKILQRWENAGACNLTTSVTGALEFKFVPDQGFVLSKTAASSWQRPWPVRSVTVPDCARSGNTINGSKRRL